MIRTIRNPFTQAVAVCALGGTLALAHRFAAAQDKPLLNTWDTQYQSAGQTIAARDKVLAEIKAYLDAHASDPNAYRTATLGYNHLNENSRAVEVTREFLKRFPDNASWDSLVLFIFGNYGTATDISSVPAHVQNEPQYWDWTMQVLSRSNSDSASLEHAGTQALKRISLQTDAGGAERIKVAETWLSSDVDPHAAEQVAREAVSISEIGPPADFSPTDQKTRTILDRLEVRDIDRSTLGWALYKEGQYPQAFAELERAAKTAEASTFSTRDVYFRLGQTFEKLGRPRDALLAYDKEIAWGNSGLALEQRRAEVYKQVHGSLLGLNTNELNRVNALAMERARGDSALVSDLDQDLGRFSLLDESGKPLDIKQYRGKLVIIDFWATWCGQCLITMKQTDALQRKFPGQVVVIAPSGDTELTRAEASRYLDKMKYGFVLVYDDEKRRQIHLPYIPARLLLDQKGRLRFMEVGASPTGGVILERKVQSLLQEKGQRAASASLKLDHAPTNTHG
jgi:thiol-disulfide isomerase/thioredoxin